MGSQRKLMDFIQYLWQRAEYYTRITVITAVILLVMFTLALTYESRALYLFASLLSFSYIAYMFGYELLYKDLKERYNKYVSEQESLFDNIKDPK